MQRRDNLTHLILAVVVLILTLLDGSLLMHRHGLPLCLIGIGTC